MPVIGFVSAREKNVTLPTTLTYNGYAMDIRRNDDIRYCTHCERYDHTTGRCRSRLADQESRQQQRRDLQHQQETQYQLEIDAINEREEAEHAEITTQFEAVTADIERAHPSDDLTEHLLHELEEKEASVDWLRERYADMRSSVAQRYNIPDSTPAPACPSKDVDAALVSHQDTLVVADTSLSPVISAPQVHPPTEIAVTTPSADDHSSEDDDAEPSADEASPVIPLPPPAVSHPPPPTSDQPAVVFPVNRISDVHLDEVHVYHLPIVGIAPHRPLKPFIEEEVLLWLRLRRHDSSLAWEGNTLVFRTRCALAESRFQRPAGQYTWTLGRRSPILVLFSFLYL